MKAFSGVAVFGFLAFGLMSSVYAQVNVTTYGYGVPTKYTTITPTAGGYQATTYGYGVPTTYSTINTPSHTTPYQSSKIGSGIGRESGASLQIPNYVAPIDWSAQQRAADSLNHSFQDAQAATLENIRKKEAMRQSERQAQIEGQQLREYMSPTAVEARRQATLAQLEEAKLQREAAQIQLEILKAQREALEEKARQEALIVKAQQEAATAKARQEIQIQNESAEAKTKHKATETPNPEEIAPDNRKAPATKN
jgi:hypothetical protein